MNSDKQRTRGLINIFESQNTDDCEEPATVSKENQNRSKRYSNASMVGSELDLLADRLSNSRNTTPTLPKIPKISPDNIKAGRVAQERKALEKFFERSGGIQRNLSASNENKCVAPSLEHLKSSKVAKEKELFDKFRIVSPEKQPITAQVNEETEIPTVEKQGGVDIPNIIEEALKKIQSKINQQSPNNIQESEKLKLENEKLQTSLNRSNAAIEKLKKELSDSEKKFRKANADKFKLEQRLKATRATVEVANEPTGKDGSQYLTLVQHSIVEVHNLYKASCKIYRKTSNSWLKQEIIATLGHVRTFCKTKPDGKLSTIDSFKLHCELNMKLNKGELGEGEQEIHNRDLEGEWEGIVQSRLQQFKIKLIYLLCKAVEHQNEP